jgi:hypothetical protein
LKNDKPIPLYGEVCHGKGNARLFLDMWKRAFELFVQHESLTTGREIARMIENEMKGRPGLDQPQFKQRSLNTWSQFKQYGNLRNRRAGMFFNVLPAPVDTGFGMDGQSFDIDQYFGKSLYCQGGSDIDVAKLLTKGEVWWQSDNAPASNFVGEDKPYRLQTVAEAIGDYFNRPEFKSKGEYGALERHRVAVFQREYVGKETNFLLDADLPDDDETQIEDAAAAPYFRYGFNPVLRAQYLSMPDIAETLAVTSPEALDDVLKGYAPSVHATRVLAHLRKGTRYNELTGTCVFDGFIREVDMTERQAARLVDLARRSFKKMNAICKAHNVTAKPTDYDGPPQFTRYHMNRRPTVELAAQFDLICENERHKKNCAHDLLNPLLYPDKAAIILKQGFVRTRSGQELRVDDAIAMFENYLGIAQRKKQIATDVKTLNASQAERRRARRLQSRKMLMQAVSKIQMATLDDHVRMLKKMFVEDYGFNPADVEKNSPIIERLALSWPLALPDFQMLFRRHTQIRRGRPDVKRFVHDLLDRVTDRAERVRALARVRKHRSRLKQSAEPEDRRVQVDLRGRNSIKKLNA